MPEQSTPLDLGQLKRCLTAAEVMMLKGRTVPPAELRDLRSFDIPQELRARAAKETGRVAGHVVMTMLRRQPVDEARVERLHTALRGARPSLATDAVAYIRAVCAMNRIIAAAKFHATHDLRPLQAELLALVRSHAEEAPEAASLRILEGGLISLTDRTAASAHFAQATSGGPSKMATSVFDLGAHTYACGRTISDPGEGPERAAVEAAVAGTEPPSLAYIVISADVDFLRLYGPQWFSFAALLETQGIGLVIGVIGPADEVALLIEQSRDLIARMGRLRNEDGHRTAAMVVMVPLPDPSVADAKTYYACARHLMALPLIEATGKPVLIADADQVIEQAVDTFVGGLLDYDVGMVGARGLPAVWPWRRHMAGTGWFNATDGGRAVLASMGRYIRANLHIAPSWTLDQNAKSYALEAHPEASRLVYATTAMPFNQNGIRSQQEKLWRARKAAV